MNLALFVCLLFLTAVCVVTYAAKQPGPVNGNSPDLLSAQISQEDEPEPLPPLTLEEIRTVSFKDVAADSAWADSICYAAYQGFMNGAGDGVFQPEGLMSRAAAIVTLFRMSGDKAPAYTGPYQDVQAEDWYAGEIAWAIQADLLDGACFPSNALNPKAPVTREELAVLLVRHAGYMSAKGDVQNTAADTPDHASRQAVREETAPEEAEPVLAVPADKPPSLDKYKDAASVPPAYADYVAEALQYGLFNGMVFDTIYPGLPVNRGQFAQALIALSALETGEPLAAELAGKLQAKTVTSTVAENHESMQAKVEEIAAKYGAVGLQAAVVEDGEVTDSFACGWAEKNTAPMTADHKMRVASLSKVSVGMAAMVLRDRGVIDLDASIGDYWGISTQNPYYPHSPVSVRALLTHTSSIPLYGDNVSRSKSAVESKLRNNQYNNMKPGSVWSWGYNNYGYAVLGMTLELAGRDYLDNILGQSLWSVMGIDAAFEGGEIQAADKIVTIYRHDGSVGRSAETQRQYKRPDAPGGSGSSFAGGLTISANDLGKLLGLLINDGTYQGLRLLSEESAALMETRFDQILSDGTYQALSLRSQDHMYGRDRLYYHTGSAYGVYNFMSYDPETGDGIVVLSSGASASKDGNGIYAVCGDIARYFYELTANPPH